jgi:hypothetical protein
MIVSCPTAQPTAAETNCIAVKPPASRVGMAEPGQVWPAGLGCPELAVPVADAGVPAGVEPVGVGAVVAGEEVAATGAVECVPEVAAAPPGVATVLVPHPAAIMEREARAINRVRMPCRRRHASRGCTSPPIFVVRTFSRSSALTDASFSQANGTAVGVSWAAVEIEGQAFRRDRTERAVPSAIRVGASWLRPNRPAE